MRLLPAHIRDAKDMARDLFHAFTVMEVPGNWNILDSPPPSLQKTQEIMASAMGYAGWRELSKLVTVPHKPIYFDSDEVGTAGGAMLEQLVKRLSELLGLDYAHGSIFNAVSCAGVGYSPKERRVLKERSTPWGVIVDEPIELASGIKSVSTSSHGGLLLSPDRISKVPSHLRFEDGAYEEDGECYLVALAFPEEAASMGLSLRGALAYLGLVDVSAELRAHSELITDLLNSSRSSSTHEIPTLVEPPLSDFEEKIIAYLGTL